MGENLSYRRSEAGSAGAKLLLVAVVLVLGGHAFINLVPVMYNGETFRQEMQTAVVQGMLVPATVGNAVEVTKKRLANSARSNNIPNDALIQVKLNNSVLTAHVSYVKKVPLIPFGIWDYEYRFDYTATPTGYFTKEGVGD